MQAIEITASRAGLLLCARPRDREEDHRRRAAAPGRPAAGGEDEGAPRLLGERAVLRAPEGARDRGRRRAPPADFVAGDARSSDRAGSFASNSTRRPADQSGAWEQAEPAACAVRADELRRPTTHARAGAPASRRTRGPSRCRTRRRHARPLWGRGALVGTSPSAMLVLSDATVSARHCALSVLGGGVAIETSARATARSSAARASGRRGAARGRSSPSGGRRSSFSAVDEDLGTSRPAIPLAGRRRHLGRCASVADSGAAPRAARAARCSSRARAGRARSSSPARSTPRGRDARGPSSRINVDGAAPRARRERAVRARAGRVHRRARSARWARLRTPRAGRSSSTRSATSPSRRSRSSFARSTATRSGVSAAPGAAARRRSRRRRDPRAARAARDGGSLSAATCSTGSSASSSTSRRCASGGATSPAIARELLSPAGAPGRPPAADLRRDRAARGTRLAGQRARAPERPLPRGRRGRSAGEHRRRRHRLALRGDRPARQVPDASSAQALLRDSAGNLSAAARAAGMPRTSFRKLLGA